MLPRHIIKSYDLIECDKSYPLADVNDKFTMVIFILLSPYEKSGINSILLNGNLELYPYILSLYLDIVILSFDQC
jgi:hypothetical protein